MKLQPILNEIQHHLQTETYDRFTEWVCEELGIRETPEIRWYDNPLKTGSQPAFAQYDVGANRVTVCRGGRHPMDILRSLAHELFHAFQRERGALTPDSGRTGDPIENQANAIAGVLIRKWGRRNPHLYGITEVGEGDSMARAILRRWRDGRPGERAFISLSLTGRKAGGEVDLKRALRDIWRQDLVDLYRRLGLDTGFQPQLTEKEFMLNRPKPATRPAPPRKRPPTPPAETPAQKINRQTKRVKINQDTLRIARNPNQKRIWTARVRKSQDKLKQMKAAASAQPKP